MNKETLLQAEKHLDNRGPGEFVSTLQSRFPAYGLGNPVTPVTPVSMVVSEPDAPVWRFPDPAALSALSRAAYSNQAIRHLPFEFLPTGFQTVEEIAEIRSTVISDRPGSRRIVKHELSSAVNGSIINVFGKIYFEQEEREIYRWSEELWKRSEQSMKFFKIARPLSHNESLKIVWQKGLDGELLLDRLNEKTFRKLLGNVAQALAAFHQVEYPIQRQMTIQHRLELAQKKLTHLQSIFPDLERLLKSLEAGIRHYAPLLKPFPQFTLHGDLHLSQILVSNNRPALFDCAEPAIGDPLQDVASLLADLYSHRFDMATIDAMSSVVIETYLLEMGLKIPADRLHWHMAVQLILQADQNQPLEKEDFEAGVLRRLEIAQCELEMIPATIPE